MAFKNSSDEKFNDQISGNKLSLIQFSASWCGPCQQLKPIVEKISNDINDSISILVEKKLDLFSSTVNNK